MTTARTQDQRTQHQQYGRAIGALIFTGFGALWLLLGLYVRQQLDAANVAWIAGGVLTLAAAAMQVLRRAERRGECADDAKRTRAFHWINGGQWVAIFIVMTILKRMHLDVYGISAIAAIVGLHLFPMARVFRNPLHYVTGSLLAAWAAGTAMLAPADTMQGVTALGTGAIEWFSAAVTLGFALYAVRRAPRFHEQARTA